MYSGGSGLSIDIHFVDLELSYDDLSPLPIVLSKHFNPISDYMHGTWEISSNIETAFYMCVHTGGLNYHTASNIPEVMYTRKRILHLLGFPTIITSQMSMTRDFLNKWQTRCVSSGKFHFNLS